MHKPIDPKSKLGRRLLTIGTHYQNKSSGKSGRVSRWWKEDSGCQIMIGVTAKGTLSLNVSGDFEGTHTVIELRYGNLSVEQYLHDHLEHISDRDAVKLLERFLKAKFKHVPSKVARDHVVHI